MHNSSIYMILEPQKQFSITRYSDIYEIIRLARFSMKFMVWKCDKTNVILYSSPRVPCLACLFALKPRGYTLWQSFSVKEMYTCIPNYKQMFLHHRHFCTTVFCLEWIFSLVFASSNMTFYKNLVKLSREYIHIFTALLHEKCVNINLRCEACLMARGFGTFGTFLVVIFFN